jgi:hypothetical protein
MFFFALLYLEMIIHSRLPFADRFLMASTLFYLVAKNNHYMLIQSPNLQGEKSKVWT